MITKDITTSGSKLSQPAPVFRTIANRSMGTLEYGAGAISGIAGESMLVLPAFRDGVRAITAPVRAHNEITISNSAYIAGVENLRRARGEHFEVYELTSQMRINAAERYAIEASKIAYTQATATITVARAQCDLAAGGVERGYRHQAQGIDSAYRLNLEANQLNFAGAVKVAERVRTFGLEALKLDQMLQSVTTPSRDMARRAELALMMRY